MIWLLIVGATTGFASTIYIGGHEFKYQSQCIAVMDKLELEYGYGGICTTMKPEPIRADISVEEDQDQQEHFAASIIVTNIRD